MQNVNKPFLLFVLLTFLLFLSASAWAGGSSETGRVDDTSAVGGTGTDDDAWVEEDDDWDDELKDDAGIADTLGKRRGSRQRRDRPDRLDPARGHGCGRRSLPVGSLRSCLRSTPRHRRSPNPGASAPPFHAR